MESSCTEVAPHPCTDSSFLWAVQPCSNLAVLIDGWRMDQAGEEPSGSLLPLCPAHPTAKSEGLAHSPIQLQRSARVVMLQPLRAHDVVTLSW